MPQFLSKKLTILITHACGLVMAHLAAKFQIASLLIAQDRYTRFLPTLSKYSSLTVALTLMVIGALGLQETLHTAKEAKLQLVGVGAPFLLQHEYCMARLVMMSKGCRPAAHLCVASP